MTAITLTPQLTEAMTAMLEVVPLAPRVCIAHDGKSQIVAFDASSGDDRVCAPTAEQSAALLAAAGIPVPELFALKGDELFFCRSTPAEDDYDVRPLLQRLHSASIPAPSEDAARVYADLTPFIRHVVPQLTGRPLPAAAADELKALLRGILPALGERPPVPTLGEAPIALRLRAPVNGEHYGLLPLCDIRIADIGRDRLANDGSLTAGRLFYDLLGLLRGGEVHSAANTALADPRSQLLGYWLDRWVPEDLRIA